MPLQLRKNQAVELTWDQLDGNLEYLDNRISDIPQLPEILSVSRGGTSANTIDGARTVLGVNNVNNTSDAAKPVSVPQQDALDLKLDEADLDAAIVPYLPAGTGAVETTVEQQLRDIQLRVVYVSDAPFYAVWDGVTDDSAAFQAGLDYVKLNGGALLLPAGTGVVKNIRLESATAPYSIVGAGKHLTTLKHLDGDGTLMIGNAGSSVPYTLSDFTVDCQFAETAHANANNAISFADTSGVVIRRVRVQNYKNNGILGFATAENTFGDCIGEDCEAIGNGATTNNGLIFAEMPRCKWIDSSAKSIQGAPGYGVQLKNDSRWGQISNGYAEDCVAGLALGTDSVGLGAQNSVVQGFQSVGCATGAMIAEAKQCRVEGLIIDMESAVENGIEMQSGTVGTVVKATVRNINASRSAVRLRSGATDNSVHVDSLDNINSTAKAVLFDSGALRNTAVVDRVTNPTSLTNGPRQWVTFTTKADNNAFELQQVPYCDSLTIASGVVALSNATTHQNLIVDTEAAAASDDLETITNTFAREGQTIIIRTANDARDVVLKQTGNINLAGAADCTLGTRRSMISLEWNESNSKWNEMWRVANP